MLPLCFFVADLYPNQSEYRMTSGAADKWKSSLKTRHLLVVCQRTTNAQTSDTAITPRRIHARCQSFGYIRPVGGQRLI